MNTAIVLLSSIESHQNEIIGAVINQAVEFIPNAYIIDFYKDYKLNKVLDAEPEIIKAEQWKFDSWKSMYKHYKKLVSDFDNIILVKAPINRDNANTLDTKMLREINKMTRLDDTYNMQYDLMRRVIERLLFVKACRGKNVVHFVIDPDEVDFSKVWNFKSYRRIGALKWNNCEYGPIYEYVLYNTFIQDIPKFYDFYYVGSAITDDRKYLYRCQNEVLSHINRRRIGFIKENPKIGTFDIFDSNNREKRVSQSTYLYNLKLSRYTMINPPYNKNEFNIIRFMEAVICDCIPLILKCKKDVRDMKFGCLYNLILTFPDIYDIITKRDLIVVPKEIHIRLTKYYEDSDNGSVRKVKYGTYGKPDIDICEQIKETKSFKKITDRDYVQSFYDGLFSEVPNV